jgi:hypothetical protein
MGFVVDTVALGQDFLRVLRFLLSISFHPGSTVIQHVGMDNRSVAGRSSEAQCHSTDMNNNNNNGSDMATATNLKAL